MTDNTASTPSVDDLMRWRRIANGYHTMMLALCMVCGSVRSATRPRRRDYDSNTGELKCQTCGQSTLHALVTGASHDEERHTLALGLPARDGLLPDSKMMDAYRTRSGLPRNPRLQHIWSAKSERQAIADGAATLRAFCGEVVPAPRSADESSSIQSGDLAQRNTDYDHPDADGWIRQDCVNCLRVYNHNAAMRRRKTLSQLMIVAIAELQGAEKADRYDAHSAELIAALRAVHGEGR